MKSKYEIILIHDAIAPRSEFGSFLSGYRAAERERHPHSDWLLGIVTFISGAAVMQLIHWIST